MCIRDSPNALTVAGNIKTGSLTCDGNAIINGTLTGTAITSLLGSGFNSNNLIVGSGLTLKLNSTGVNSGKYEIDLDPTVGTTTAALTATYGITCASFGLNSGQTAFTINSTGATMIGPYPLTVNGTITGGSIISSGPTVLNGAVTGAGITNLFNLYYTKSTCDIQYALKNDVALLQDVVNGSTAQTNNYYLNTGIGGLYVRNGTNIIAQFHYDGTTYIYNTLYIAGPIAGAGLTQINTLVTNAISTFQDNANITNLTTIGTASIQNGLSVLGALGVTGTLTVSGKVTMPGFLFCAGVVGSTGTKYSTSGQATFTVARYTGAPAGIWVITFSSAHPLGANYVVTVTPRNSAAYICFNPAPTSTTFTVTLTAPGTASPPVDAIFSFMVLA